MLGEARLEHEGHRVIELVRGEFCIRGPLKGIAVWPVGQHHVVQAHATRNKALRLGIILTVDITHQFGHDILVVPGRSERIFSNHPAFAKQDEIDIGRARYAR